MFSGSAVRQAAIQGLGAASKSSQQRESEVNQRVADMDRQAQARAGAQMNRDRTTMSPDFSTPQGLAVAPKRSAADRLAAWNADSEG